ncbi:23562_t:CDS:2 [Entrophospora sp. SA101]|nr:23562_t:CDS:2 [Entrophospora sp. SA101]
MVRSSGPVDEEQLKEAEHMRRIPRSGLGTKIIKATERLEHVIKIEKGEENQPVILPSLVTAAGNTPPINTNRNNSQDFNLARSFVSEKDGPVHEGVPQSKGFIHARSDLPQQLHEIVIPSLTAQELVKLAGYSIYETKLEEAQKRAGHEQQTFNRVPLIGSATKVKEATEIFENFLKIDENKCVPPTEEKQLGETSQQQGPQELKQ